MSVPFEPAIQACVKATEKYISSTTGIYNSPMDSSYLSRTAIVRVTDAAGAQVCVDGHGGLCPFTFSLTSGTGQLNNFAYTQNNFAQLSTSCGLAVYTAPTNAESATVSATDGAGNATMATPFIGDPTRNS